MEQLLNFGTMFACVIRRTFPVLLSAWIVSGTVSCSSESTPPQAGTENSIAFGVGGDMSRAVVTSALRKIGVFGYSHSGAFSASAATAWPDYFLNQAVIDAEDDGIWTYSGVTKYWPAAGVNLSFFAYAPYIDVEDTFTLKPSSVAQKGAPTIEYTVPADIYKQIDLLWSNSLDQTYASNGGQVDFEMNHALTRLNFQIMLHEDEKGRPFIVGIEELIVRNVVGAGTLDLSKTSADAGLWTITRPDDDSGWAQYTLLATNGGGLETLEMDARNDSQTPGEVDPYIYNDIFTAGDYLMLIPQQIDDQFDGLTPAEIVIKYYFTNVYSGETEQREETLMLARPGLEQWEPGQGINYQLTLSLVEGVVIEFDIEGFVAGTPWVDMNSGSPIEGDVN